MCCTAARSRTGHRGRRCWSPAVRDISGVTPCVRSGARAGIPVCGAAHVQCRGCRSWNGRGGAGAERIEASSAPNAGRVRTEGARVRIVAENAGAGRFRDRQPLARRRRLRDRRGGDNAPHRRAASDAAGRRLRGLKGRAAVPDVAGGARGRAAAHGAAAPRTKGRHPVPRRSLPSRATVRGVHAPDGALPRPRPVAGAPRAAGFRVGNGARAVARGPPRARAPGAVGSGRGKRVHRRTIDEWRIA